MANSFAMVLVPRHEDAVKLLINIRDRYTSLKVIPHDMRVDNMAQLVMRVYACTPTITDRLRGYRPDLVVIRSGLTSVKLGPWIRVMLQTEPIPFVSDDPISELGELYDYLKERTCSLP